MPDDALALYTKMIIHYTRTCIADCGLHTAPHHHDDDFLQQPGCAAVPAAPPKCPVPLFE